MAIVGARKIQQIAEAEDPKQGILDAVGDLSDIEVFYGNVLVGTYVGKAMLGSIHLPDEVIAENEWQSKVGLVLKVGPGAFNYGEGYKGQSVKPGDWIVFAVNDTRVMHIRHAPCRLLADTAIKMKISDPTLVY